MDLPGGSRVGNYVVERPLGRGGAAVVYAVRHEVLGTRHALKVLTSPSARARDRLLDEGRIQAHLRHPNVVAVTDVVEVHGMPGLLLELVQGPTLHELIGAGPLPPDVVRSLAAGVLSGVAAAHAQGLVHRDLKPGNVLVAVDGGRLVPRVTDFGLARWLEEDGADRRTRTGASLGTPRYMAPEQIRDARAADARSDVWALGVLLYELATGEPPFDSPDLLELYSAIDRAVCPPLARADLPEAWRLAVASALRRDPGERPADAGALLAACGGPADPIPVDRDLQARLDALAPQASPGSAREPTWGGQSPPTWPKSADTAHQTTPLSAPSVSTMGTPAPARAAVAPPVTPATPTAPPVAPLRPPRRLHRAVTGLALAALAAWWWLRIPTEEPPTEASPVVAEVGAPVAPKVAPPFASGIVGEAYDLLLDAKLEEASAHAGFALAGAEDPTPHRIVGVASLATGRWIPALEELEKGVRVDPHDLAVGAQLEGTFDPSTLDAWLAARPDDLLARATRVLQGPLGDPVAASAHVDALAAAAPGRHLPLLAAARIGRLTGDAERADQALAAWRASAPDALPLRLESVKLAFARGQLEAAAAELDGLVAAPVAPPDAWVLRAAIDARLGRDAAMARDLEQVLRLPADAQLRVRLALADGALERGDLAAAWTALDDADVGIARFAGDERCNWLRIVTLGESARLAAIAGDAARVEATLALLRGAVGGHTPGWAKGEAQRTLQVTEALLAHVRGAADVARAAHAELQAEGSPDVTKDRLLDVLEGRARLRVREDLLW